MKTKAFTIVELLIAAVIIGILAALIFPWFEGVRIRARLKEIYQTVEIIKAAELYYYEKKAGYYYGFSWDGSQLGDDGNTYTEAENNLHITIPQGANAFCQYRTQVNNAAAPPRCYIFAYTISRQPGIWLYIYSFIDDATAKNSAHDYSDYVQADATL